MSTAITAAPAAQLLDRLNRQELSAVEVTEAFLDRIKKIDGDIGAFLLIDAEAALEQAKAVDRKREAGEALGPLAGLPVGIKDAICTKGQTTTCGSRMLENFVPPYDAHVIEKLRSADAVLLGKLNMDEFAMGSSSENSAFKPVSNPWDTNCTPGGSSGGSAAAVAARMLPLALGSDTGGSIRQPASFCGVVGLKPTYGRVSRYGLIAFASSLDQIGPFAADVTGAALLMEIIAGHDRRDSTSVDFRVPRYRESLEQPLKGLKIGIAAEYFRDGLAREVETAVREAIDVYQSLGAEVREIHLPHSQYAVATYYLIAPSEASSNLARYDGVHYGFRSENFDSKDMIDMYETTRGEGFGAEVKRRIMLGTYSLSAGYKDAYYVKALKARRLIRQDFDGAFAEVDLIASPVAPSPPFRIGELADDPLAMYLSDIYTLSANLAGLPGISIPCGFSGHDRPLPIGLQLVAPPFEEERLLRAARMYERETDWHTRAPKLAAS